MLTISNTHAICQIIKHDITDQKVDSSKATKTDLYRPSKGMQYRSVPFLFLQLFQTTR